MDASDATSAMEGLDGGLPQPPKRRSRRLVLLVGGGLVIIALATGGAAFFSGMLSSPSDVSEEEVEAEDHGSDAGGHEMPQQAVLFELPRFVVNLNVSGRNTRFLKLRSQLELFEPEDVQVAEAALPRIVDAFQVYLRELRPEDLKGSAGTHRLREALTRRVAAEIGPERLSRVLFVDLLVQ